MDGLDFGTYECDVDTSADGCYDGAIVDGWECYGGSKSAPDTCTEICGDGIHHSTATTVCDDGNYVDLDGCSSSCETEDGFTLIGSVASATPQTFDEECDGYDYGYLDCDCGSSATCDGCDTTCNVIAGWTCLPPDEPSDGSTCTEICGDNINYDSYDTIAYVTDICDDGNTRNNDGCSGTCVVETGFACSTTDYTAKDTCYEICGDGLDYKRYACEDGNDNEYDGCSSTCTVNEGWYCYGGSKTQEDTCYETCGDGRNYAYWYDDNSCDDGNTDANDGCDSSCNIESGYDCVNGDYDSADYCYETCGDGMRFNTLTTYCDDGNTDYDDGCDDNCFVEEGFYCYGGDSTAYDACFEDCGDSLRFTGSGITTFCDDGNNEPDDGCDAICAVESGWYCTGGSSSQPDTCYEVCGDGFDFGEFECDDGNEYDADGCSSSCEVEDNYECYGGTTGQADTCYDICGDGYDMGPNECDDGDLTSVDGCKSDCTIRAGWACVEGDHTTASSCYEICGDNYHYFYDVGSMECDDGNNNDYDGCDSTCGREVGFTCTSTWTTDATSSIDSGYDTVSDCTEICQDGMNFNDNSDYCDTDTSAGTDGCTSSCDVVEGWYCGFGGYTTQDKCYEICGDEYNWGALECDYL
jgi:cysteine-rich repeat protein